MRVAQDQLRENGKVGLGRAALNAAQHVVIGGFGQQPQGGLDLVDTGADGGQIQPLRMVTAKMLQQPSAVIELAGQEHFCDRQGTFAVIGGAILFGPQQDIALHRTGNAGEKAAVAAQKAQADVSLGAGTHEGGTDAAIAEGDNGLQIVQRHAPSTSSSLRTTTVSPSSDRYASGVVT